MKIKTPENWRKGQTLFNFFEWLVSKGIPTGQMGDRCADIFYMSDEELDKYYKEYLKSVEVSYETDEL